MNNTQKILMYDQRKANKSTIWLLFLFFGWSYGSMGQAGKQILFYVTLGGLGVWTIIRLFTLNQAINDYNTKVAQQIGLEIYDVS